MLPDGTNPLPEPMFNFSSQLLCGSWLGAIWQVVLVRLICSEITLLSHRGQWVNSSPPSAANMSVNWVSIGSNNGLPPIQCRAIIWTKAGLSLIGTLQTYSVFQTKIFTWSPRNVKKISLLIWPIIIFTCPRSNLTAPVQFLFVRGDGWPLLSNTAYFSEIWIKTQTFSLKKLHFKKSSAKWWPFCPGRDELNI